MGIFKAYDIRGIVPDDLDMETARRIGSALVQVLGAKTVAVGRDMRTTSPEIEDAALDGMVSAGATALDIGLCSTPMTYFAGGFHKTDAAMMITASHNPAQYNGFKLCREEAKPMSYDSGIGEIEKMVTDNTIQKAESPGDVKKTDIWPDYIAHIRRFLKTDKPLKVVVDAGNGIAGEVVPRITEGLSLEIIPLYFELDGSFPNHEANPLKPENIRDLQKKVLEEKADIGIAYDGDGDRLMFVDEKGEAVKSDLVTVMLAHDFLKDESGGSVIYDLRSSRVVLEEIEALGGKALESRVGHSFIKELMRKTDAVFAGELSGHYYFRDNFYSDSGDITFFRVLNLLAEADKPLSEILAPWKRYNSTGEINFEVEDKDGMMEKAVSSFPDAEITRLDGVTIKMKDWWCNLRKSNTEPVLRLNLEADTPEKMEEMKEKVAAIIQR